MERQLEQTSENRRLMDDRIYTVAQVAERFEFKTTRPIREEVKAGRLRAAWLPSGDIRIAESDIEAWWQAMVEPAAAAPTRPSLSLPSRPRQVARPHPKRFQPKPGPSLLARGMS